MALNLKVAAQRNATSTIETGKRLTKEELNGQWLTIAEVGLVDKDKMSRGKVVTDENGEVIRLSWAQFRFKEPCFKGIVLFCKDEAVFNEVKTMLDGVDMNEWIDRILDYNKDGIKVRVMRGSSETGIIKQGQNEYVDKIVFGKGEYKPMENYPYVNVIGRILKQPDSFQDVAGQVAEDYQNYLEDEWIKVLRKKYNYKIYRKALKKVSLDI